MFAKISGSKEHSVAAFSLSVHKTQRWPAGFDYMKWLVIKRMYA
jgi:hypothetical protein